MSLEEVKQAKHDLNRASLAEQVVSNSIYQEAITMMKADCFRLFESSNQSDERKHNEVWLQLNAIKEFQLNLEYIMDNGVMAKQTLTALERVKKVVGL